MASTFGDCSVLSAVVLLMSMCICFTQLLAFSVAEAIPSGFSVNLIHRDSPVSPLYNPLETRFDRLYSAYNRSISRINRFRPTTPKAVQSDIVPSGGEYFMEIFIGTPPFSVLGIADTGSDLTWVQCEPCEECYEQKPPLFDPRKSSTYKNVPCESNPCNALDSSDRVCDQEQNACKYNYSYGDRSFTKGNVALEKFTIGVSTRNPVSFPNLVFGCGHNNGGTFDDVGSGIVGLGGGPLSLVKQLGKSIRGKFSYCLAPTAAESNASSTIIFGTATESNINANAVSTHLVDKDPSTYYYLTLEAVSVGDERLAYGGSSLSPTEKGNIIIDSGTTLTFLESEFFNGLESAVEDAIGAKRVSDPKGLLSPCFEVETGKGIDLPIITVHFSGADVKLQPWNTFAQVQEDMVCLTIIPSNDIAIFGNLSQMDFLVRYDLEERTVSFTPTDCSNP
ncbi:probable aspartic protease At2g35615 [Durio zibethinus]|uniref:Probable aspartic protease At2g35615 n=1 Tax=Durio zibethinus TaxID=66656 RepID=A0A6P5Y6A3_DURZI|nr:probable aspartic protease At2g35615 [Durio zibethinus]